MTSNMNSIGPQQVAHKSKPLPTIVSSSLIAPMFAKPITRLTQMEQHLENLLAQLESPSFDDLDQVIELLNRLNDILCPSKNNFAYKSYLKANFNRIVSLLSDKHCQLVINNYLHIPNNQAETNPEIVTRLQRLLDITTALLTSLLRDYHQFNDDDMSRKTREKLFLSVVQYVLEYHSTTNSNNSTVRTIRGINGKAVYELVKNILSGGPKGSSGAQPKVVSPLQTGLLTVALCDFRNMIMDQMNRNIEHERLVRQTNSLVDALASLIEFDHFTGFFFQSDAKNLKEFIYELYAMYELCIQIYNCPYLINQKRVLKSIQYYVVWICRSLGDRVWMHFELVDKEIRDLKINPEQVELFKFMAIGGFTRPAKSTNPKNIPTISDSGESIGIQAIQLNPFDLHHYGIESNFAILEPANFGSNSDQHPEEPDSAQVTKSDLVNTSRLQDTKESHSVQASTTTSITFSSNLSKEDKQKMFAELQKMQQDLLKSQQTLSELLHKLTGNQNISNKDK